MHSSRRNAKNGIINAFKASMLKAKGAQRVVSKSGRFYAQVPMGTVIDPLTKDAVLKYQFVRL